MASFKVQIILFILTDQVQCLSGNPALPPAHVDEFLLRLRAHVQSAATRLLMVMRVVGLNLDMQYIGMPKTGCSGEIRLVLHVPSSS